MSGRTTPTRLQEAYERSEFTRHADLARKLDVSEAHVSRWLRGVHTPSRAYRKPLAKALGTKVEELWP